MPTVIVLGMLVGTVLGLTGAGGGIFAVPALVLGLGWGVQQAGPVALTAVAAAATVGAIEGLRKGLVRYKAASLMAITGLAVTSLGLQAAHILPAWSLFGLFAIAMIVAAFRMYRTSLASLPLASGQGDTTTLCRMNPSTGKLHWTPRTAAILGSVGLLSGFLTGLLGVGGGFVIVPALKQVSDITMHGIVATSLMVVAFVASGAVVVAWWHGASIPGQIALPFVVATAAGMFAGRLLISKIPAVIVQRTFAAMMAAVAISFVAKAAGTF